MKPQLDVSPDSNKEGFAFDINYIRRIPALLKLIEFMLLLFSFSFAASFKSGIVKFHSGANTLAFHVFVTVCAWLGCIALILAHLFNVINILKKNLSFTILLLTIVHGIGAFFILMSTAFVLNQCVSLRSSYLGGGVLQCDAVALFTDTSCAIYELSGAFGFFSFLAVLGDTVLHAMKYMSERAEAAAARAESNEESATHVAQISKPSLPEN